jgi:hypothetical protein
MNSTSTRPPDSGAHPHDVVALPAVHRWLFSPRVDFAAFFGTSLVAFLLALTLSSLGIAADTPPWLWLALVVLIDVAHVWSTLFRVYLDPAERSRRPLLYWGTPLLAWGSGMVLHAWSSELFWRALAYFAVWHFIRQQMGWMALYGRRAGSPSRTLKWDQAAILAATLGPVVWWHANLPRSFWWFREGDFITGLPHAVGTAALAVHFLVLALWLARGEVHLGKALVLAATWLSWFGGIVWAQSDLAFTILNVAAHGVPYLVLLFRYARARAAEGRAGALSLIMRWGRPGFLGLVWALALAEEFAWDTVVWHEHPMFFGAGGVDLEAAALAVVVPLLAVPQVTHYLLDGLVWKTRTDPALGSRLFASGTRGPYAAAPT